MKKIIIDLDVMSIGLSKRIEEGTKVAKEYLANVKKGEFEIYIPFSLPLRILFWRDRPLVIKIFSFYSIYSDRILTWKEIKKSFGNIDYKTVIKMLERIGVKKEDALLVLIASIFNLGIVTFNKKHLLKKYEEINKVLKNLGLREVEIGEPS